MFCTGVESMEVENKAGESGGDLENSSHYRNDNKRQRVSSRRTFLTISLVLVWQLGDCTWQLGDCMWQLGDYVVVRRLYAAVRRLYVVVRRLCGTFLTISLVLIIRVILVYIFFLLCFLIVSP